MRKILTNYRVKSRKLHHSNILISIPGIPVENNCIKGSELLHQHFECNLERNSYCSNWTFINFSLDNNDPSFASPETILHILIPAFLHRHLQDTFEHNCVNRHFWDSIQRHCINVRQYIYQSDITIQYNINHTNINFPRYDHNLDLCYW